MTIRRTVTAGWLAVLMASCGGSGSETPPPVEPVAPPEWEREPSPKPEDATEAPSDQPSAPAEPAPAEPEETPAF